MDTYQFHQTWYQLQIDQRVCKLVSMAQFLIFLGSEVKGLPSHSVWGKYNDVTATSPEWLGGVTIPA